MSFLPALTRMSAQVLDRTELSQWVSCALAREEVPVISDVETRMGQLPYQQVFERIRAEYVEMPGMQLTLAQVHRLSGVDRSICQQVLDDLVRAKFLRMAHDGRYRRLTDGKASLSSAYHAS
jgi:hypothetical protein